MDILNEAKGKKYYKKKDTKKNKPNTYWKTEDSGIQNPKKVTQFSNTCTHNLSVYVVSATYICMPIPDSPHPPGPVLHSRHVYTLQYSPINGFNRLIQWML